MIAFLIKSILCLTVLLGIYKLFLENEKMSVFNRFYLLGSLLFSFAVPFVSFQIPVETINVVPTNTIKTITGSPIFIEEKTNYFPYVIWSLYILVTSVFALRFVRNILQFSQEIKSNEKIKFENATIVLVNKNTLPHTFLNYIFINKTDFQNLKIEEELFTHELTHVRQKHTLDILFIELLKTIFWFNPVLHFYKKAIQLNHEFLADEKVVTSYKNVPFYQSLLLEKASWNSNFYLASNLNFLVTKKRMIMMTKTKSQTKILLKKIAIIPVLATLFLLSCSKTTDEKVPEQKHVIASWEAAEALGSEKKLQSGSTEFQVEEVAPENAPTQPEFPGGMKGFAEFVQKNYKVPAGFSGKGNIFASFVVEKDGTLSNIKIIRDLGSGTGDEAVRLLEKSPKWTPGMLHGEPVKVTYNLPIRLVVPN